MKIIAGLLVLLITIPIWLYLLYKILILVNATELMWFLYWIYVPSVIIVNGVSALLKKD